MPLLFHVVGSFLGGFLFLYDFFGFLLRFLHGRRTSYRYRCRLLLLRRRGLMRLTRRGLSRQGLGLGFEEHQFPLLVAALKRDSIRGEFYECPAIDRAVFFQTFVLAF